MKSSKIQGYSYVNLCESNNYRYLLTEIRNVYENKPSEVLVLEGQLVGVKPDVEVIFFSTQTPC